MDKQGTCGFGEFLKVKSKCKNRKKPVPLNKRLYNSIKSKIKATEEWPSRYASLHLVKKYKKARGKFKCAFGNNGNFETFYKDGTPNSLNLTNKIRNCQSLVYGNLRFGKPKQTIKDEIYGGLSKREEFQRRKSELNNINDVIKYLKK